MLLSCGRRYPLVLSIFGDTEDLRWCCGIRSCVNKMSRSLTARASPSHVRTSPFLKHAYKKASRFCNFLVHSALDPLLDFNKTSLIMEKFDSTFIFISKRAKQHWKWPAALWLVFLWLTLRYIPFTPLTAAETREYDHTQIRTLGV